MNRILRQNGMMFLGVIALCISVTLFMGLYEVEPSIIFVIVGAIFLGGGFCLIQNRRLTKQLVGLEKELQLHNQQQDHFDFSFAIENAQGQLDYASDKFKDIFFPKTGFVPSEAPLFGHRVLELLKDYQAFNIDQKQIEISDLLDRLTRDGKLEFLLQDPKLPNEKRLRVFVSSFEDQGSLLWSTLPETEEFKRFYHFKKRLDFLTDLMENAPFGIFSCNQNLILQEANPAALEVFGNVELKESNCIEAFHPEDQQKLKTYLEQFFQDENIPPHGVDIRMRGDGETVFALHVLRSEPGQDNEASLLVNMTDVSERIRLESQFAQSQKMQAVGQLAGGVAHDFNNMLTAIIGFCDLLLLRHRPGDSSFVDTMQIKQNANRAAGLVRQLLAFSRREEVEPRNLNIVDVFAELSSLLNRLIGDNIELDVLHGRDLGRVMFDQVQFEQMIINLAVNARDAMPQGGRLSIQTDQFKAKKPYPIRDEVMPIGDYISISVSDTGMGINKDNLAKIFDPFFTTKDVGEGTGLGLSMVFGAVRQAKGYVYVHSGGEGKGATFVIYLPKVDASEEDLNKPIDDDDITDRDDTGGGSILLVEDEDAVRLFAARALRSKGYRVTEARSGEVALTLLAEEEEIFDLLVTDMMMPKVSGTEVIHETRKYFPSIPVICISGYTKETVAADLSNLSHIYFLPKPFSLKQLATRVKEAVDSAETSQDDYKNLPLG